MLESIVQNTRLVLAQRICDLFIEMQADSDDAVSALHIAMNLIRPSGLAIVQGELAAREDSLSASDSD